LLKFNKKGLIIFFFFSLTSVIDAQINYEEVFGSDWKKAQSFEKENRDWIKQIFNKNKIPYSEAMAVIFPELVRYSALRDRMEITLLKALYINLGEEYADFSIGQLQMKPSFASKIREEAAVYLKKRSGICFLQPSDYDDVQNYRKSIVADLEDVRSEFGYLVAFLKICEKKYGTGHMIEEDRIRFLATAYNYSFEKEMSQIISMSQRKYFHTKIIKPSETYSYPEISLYWYNQFIAD
jgi:hypothetical protein